MAFDMNIKTPSHDKIVLSNAYALVDEHSRGAQVRVFSTGPLTERVVLDENDTIRLAAFLERFYRERNSAHIRAMNEETKANKAAKEARYRERRAARDA